jgi:hypothetical protein
VDEKVDFAPLFQKWILLHFSKSGFCSTFPKVDFAPLLEKVDFAPLFLKVDEKV